MHGKQHCGWMTSFFLVVCMSLIVSAPPLLWAQEGAQEPVPLNTEALRPGQYVGAASCASGNCHGSVQPRDTYAVKQNEYFTWLKQDRHTQTYNVLLSDLSARIARNLKLKGKAQQSAVCLDCHALNVPAGAQAQPLDVAEGVPCEACHGPAGGWLAGHTEKGWTHAQSVKAGMRDLRALPERAENCLSCHLGNGKKTVNHELIAAGHPDLIFELENYTAVMPPHWLPMTEQRKKEDGDTNNARAWAIGQAVAFREGMEQLARRARSGQWPEFAEMNCYACHHALREGAWRQVRGYKLKAGLPHWNPARYAVLRQIVSAFAPQQRRQIDGQIDRLATAIAYMNTPPAEAAATATALADSMQRVIPRITQAEINSRAAAKLVDAIADDMPYLVEAEIHSVEQAIMAINALISAMARDNPALAQGAVSRTIDKLYDDVKNREGFDRQRFAQHIAELQRQLR